MDKPVLESKCTLYLASFHMAYRVGGQTLSRSLSDPDVSYKNPNKIEKHVTCICTYLFRCK